MPLASSSSARILTLGAAAAAAVVLAANGLRLAGLLPDAEVLKLAAPLGAGFAVIALIGFLWTVRARSGASAAVIAGTGLGATLATALLVVVEVASHYVLGQLAADERTGLLAGPLGAFFLGASIFFLVAMLAFCVALYVGRAAPIGPLVVLALGAVLIGLRTVFPEFFAVIGVMALGGGIAWLAASVVRLRGGGEVTAVATP
ncbi:MAG: hypothetical protein ACTH31_13540 [Pseudoclavibacter sp.]